MKKLIFLSILFFAFAGSASAQTKRIAHRSHSGSNRTFNILKGDGNYGLGGQEYMHNKTVMIRVEDSARKSDSIQKANVEKAKADSQAKAATPQPAARPKSSTAKKKPKSVTKTSK